MWNENIIFLVKSSVTQLRQTAPEIPPVLSRRAVVTSVSLNYFEYIFWTVPFDAVMLFLMFVYMLTEGTFRGKWSYAYISEVFYCISGVTLL